MGRGPGAPATVSGDRAAGGPFSAGLWTLQIQSKSVASAELGGAATSSLLAFPELKEHVLLGRELLQAKQQGAQH